MNKAIINITLILGLFAFVVPINALKINQKEIRNSRPIRFKNFRGKGKVDPDHLIKNIGYGLSKKIKRSKRRRATWNYKYAIIHARGKAKIGQNNADIFIIKKGARVDHIHNIRRIIAAYLQNQYGYSYENAFTLAKFVTYYNALYRGNLNYFSKKYTKAVLRNITKYNAGIAVSYKTWPGRTRLLIPLVAGSSIDTDLITDNKVINDLKKKHDRGTKERKKIINIKKKEIKRKEKQIEKNKEQLNEKTKIIEKKKKEIENKKQKINRKKEEIKKKEERLKKRKKEIEKITNKKEKKQEKAKVKREKKKLEEEKKKLKNEEKKNNKEEKKIKKKEDSLKKKNEKLKNEKKNIDNKKEKIKEEEKEVKKDEKINEFKKNPNKVIAELDKKKKELDKERDKVMGGKMFFLRVNKWMKDGHYDNDMLIIDPIKAKITLKSPVRSIDGRKFDLTDRGVIVIVHNANKVEQHNLVLLDKDKLQLIKQGPDNIFWRSFIKVRDEKIYAMINKNKKYFLARFSTDLTLEVASKVEIDADSSISFFQSYIYVSRKDKMIIVLKKNDLTFFNEVKTNNLR